MPDDTAAEDFLKRLQRLGWLTPDQLVEIRRDSLQREVSPVQVAVERGWLDANQLDVLTILQDKSGPIPGYDLLDLIGMGGMGIVYRARQRSLDRIVAVKTIQVRAIDNPTAMERFAQEARTLAQLQHPHIVSAIDFGRHSQRVFLVMEYIDGLDLEDYGRQRTLAEREVWQLLRQAAAGLAHASEHGIIHRDIKPANLLLVRRSLPGSGSPDLLVKITDFGLARLTQQASAQTQLTADGVTLGTPRYMAPEQVQMQANDVDHRADIYSLGATAYQLLSQRPPFDGLTLTQLLAQKLAQGPAPLEELQPQLSPGSIQLVRRMMQVRPENRPDYPTLLAEMDALIVRLETPGSTGINPGATQPAGSSIAGATQPGSVSPPPRWSRPWRIAGMLFALVSLLAAGFLLSRRSPTGDPLPVRVQLEPTGPALLLFDGQQLGGWVRVSGNWVVPPNDAVIAGTDGSIKHVIGRRSGPLEAYRFEVIVELRQARSVEVQFGIALQEQQRRYACRLGDGRAEIGERASDTAKFIAIPDMAASAIDPSQAHVVVIERQPAGWFVEVDEVALGGLPHRSTLELPEIRLSAQGGPAFFSDLVVTELALQTPVPASK